MFSAHFAPVEQENHNAQPWNFLELLRILPSSHRSAFLAASLPTFAETESGWLTPPAGLKGEVRAICRFWVFDGKGLLGHQLIDSRWFEKNPPTESGWKWRSKNRRSTGISRENDRDVMSALFFAPIVTPLIYIHFCVWLWTLCRSLVVGGSVIRSWFFVKPLYSSDPRCSKKKHEAQVNWFAVACFAEDPMLATCGKPRACSAGHRPAFPVIFLFTPPDSSVRVAPRSLTSTTTILRQRQQRLGSLHVRRYITDPLSVSLDTLRTGHLLS